MTLHSFSAMANYMLFGAVNSIKKDLKVGAKIKEPDYLAAIVTKFPVLMNAMCGKAGFGGCYIHQSPYVTMQDSGNTCEAGDLLVLCRKMVNGEMRINAALFQLKRASHPFGRIHPDNQVQYDLYSHWPVFSLGRRFNPAMSRDIEPKDVTPGAQYMFINDCGRLFYDYDFPSCYSDCPIVFTHALPEPEMSNRTDLSFGRFLWHFIHWQTGRPIAFSQNLANDAWSKFIWDLITKTQNAKISNINVGIQKKHNISRQQGDVFSFMTTNDFLCHPQQKCSDINNGDDNEPPIIDDNDNDNNGKNGAISILFIDMA